jgi:serine/threonine protein kinase
MNQPEGRRQLGDFEVVRELGRGGMGVVYEARQVSLNRRVALKVLSGVPGLTAKAVQRFQREAKAAAQLHHTNIVPVYATGDEDGIHFYAMELIDGPSLDLVLRQLRAGPAVAAPTASLGAGDAASDPARTGPYAAGAGPAEAAGLSSSSLGSGSGYFDTVARLVAEVADALDYAHREGVVHRDIKPANLLLSPAGRLSVNDFGLARVLEQPGMTQTGEFVGTPLYMSPEQVTAGRAPLDYRTDIYSLGATLYELLTLRPPFTAERRDQVIAQILHKEPKAPRKVNKKVPRDLETICLKALEKDPDRRYQTAGALAEDLRRYVNRFAIVARRSGLVEQLRKWARRHPGLAAALGGVLLLTLAVGLFAYRATQAERVARAADRKLLEEKMERALDHILHGDFVAAEKTIQEAAESGAPAGWVDWRRGQIAYHRGQNADAVPLLESAVKAFPDEVAPRALLATAYVWVGDFNKFSQMAIAADRLSAVTPEDLLYKGMTQSWNDPIEGLNTLDEAVLRRDSTIARLIRARVRVLRAKETSNAGLAKDAQKDAAAARSMLPGNPDAITGSLHVQVETALLLSRDDPDYRTTLEQADRDARALADFPRLPRAVHWRGLFLEHVARHEEAALEVWRHGSKEFNDIWIDYHYILALYRRGEVSQAADVAKRWPHNGLDACLWTRAILLSERHDRKAEALKVSAELERPGATAFSVWKRAIFLRFLRERDQALAACQEARRRLDSVPPWVRESNKSLFDYFDGTITEAALLTKAGPSKQLQCSAHFVIGVTRLSGGDRDGAREHFAASVATQYIESMYYDWSRAFLARLEKDPTWPPWIPAQKDEPKP